ncbi:nucleoside-diphosphate sugar epimerase/dehydratase [Rubellicoccus peritrichatus]|uniref:Nucleoside-diphosphate sugar epimerase/dehydratase n=1 Tax=Rubellicoccus peritrichatus TaxID=3080537 RepID=A0AAQ3QW68_9BACT|nr:nucleoside-diphosphate sugar epimerase/dehydratase [Puniceicoccus sp. CR14]WOO42348.1 nucleoside-diphosphate sugar epimerase/dehydratase [Puniceicoccus sp. CR14]
MAKPIPKENVVYIILIGVLCAAALYFAYEIRWEFATPESLQTKRVSVMLWLIPLQMVILYAFGQLEVMAARMRSYDFLQLSSALGLTAIFQFYLWYVFSGKDMPGRSIILIDFMLALLAIGGLRALLQYFRGDAFGLKQKNGLSSQRIAIIGAGFVGNSLALELLTKRGFGMVPIIFIDDDSSKIGCTYCGLRVFGGVKTIGQAAAKFDIDRLVIAEPAISPSKIREILIAARRDKLDVLIVPSPQELLYGQIRADQLRALDLEDFLGRNTLDTDSIEVHDLISESVVMVTGAGGSIGSELCRQIAAKNPSRLLLLDHSEAALFTIEQKLHSEGFHSLVLPLLADVSDETRMRHIMGRYRPTIIFHSAAYKHVPMIEQQPGEAIRNNTLATAKFGRLASEYNVRRFIFISSDKAINPTNAMGASKRLAETYLQSLSGKEGMKTQFLAVRFGNVLGSSGSVVPIFKKQIREGGPVTVTHPDVTRYFMSIPEAVGLVLQCASQGHGGEIFMLDMGKPIKIVDVARQLIELNGFEPDIDIEVKFVGLRPGEKLYEELHYTKEEYAETPHPRVKRYTAEPADLAIVEAQLSELEEQVETLDRNQLKQMIRRFVPEYVPYLD